MLPHSSCHLLCLELRHTGCDVFFALISPFPPARRMLSPVVFVVSHRLRYRQLSPSSPPSFPGIHSLERFLFFARPYALLSHAFFSQSVLLQFARLISYELLSVSHICFFPLRSSLCVHLLLCTGTRSLVSVFHVCPSSFLLALIRSDPSVDPDMCSFCSRCSRKTYKSPVFRMLGMALDLAELASDERVNMP